MAEYENNGPWGSWFEGQWDVPKREAYCSARSTQGYGVELEIYNHLVNLQGVHVPMIFADVQLVPQHATAGRDENLTQCTEVRAILMEHISVFPLDDIITKVPKSDWASVCDQAIEVTKEFAEHDFINIDIKTRNIIVRCSDECS
jgi:hypothetical protein